MSSIYFEWSWLPYESASDSRFETFRNVFKHFVKFWNVQSKRTLDFSDFDENLKIWADPRIFEKIERTNEFSDFDENLKKLSGPSNFRTQCKIWKIWADPRIFEKFEKFERTLEFSDSVQNLKNLSGPSNFWKIWADPRIDFENQNFGLRKNFENLSGPSHRIRALYRGPPLLED